jgi:hypothetical protein
MTEASGAGRFQTGDAVLANLGGAPIPGVIADQRDGEYLVQLAEPWVDENNQRTDQVWLPADRIQGRLGPDAGIAGELPT